MPQTNFPIKDGNSLAVISQAVSGGTLYHALIENGGVASSVASTFVSTGSTSPVRYLNLTDAKSALGIPLTAAAGTPTGAVGITRVAGTSLQLAGETTSANAKTNKAYFEFRLSDNYIAGTDIPVIVNAVVTGAGTLTGASTTMTLAAYTETNGVEAALSVTAAQLIPATTAADLSFTVTGTTLVPGQHVAFELTMLVTSASGANTGFINSAGYQA